nr:hypothetical protein [uncultured Rhodopila sp.]
MIDSVPKYIRGAIPFVGAGYHTPVPLALANYVVSSDKRAQALYFRGGNSTTEMVTIAMLRDGKLMRYFPIGAKAADHVQLAVVEDLEPETRVELAILAPEGLSGTVVVDLGLVEI